MASRFGKWKEKLRLHHRESSRKAKETAPPEPTSTGEGQSIQPKPSHAEPVYNTADAVCRTAPCVSHPLQTPLQLADLFIRAQNAGQHLAHVSSVPTPGVTVPDSGGAPIDELWNIAYEKLRVEEAALVRDFETKLGGDAGAGLDSTRLGGPAVRRRERMEGILQRRWTRSTARRGSCGSGPTSISSKTWRSPLWALSTGSTGTSVAPWPPIRLPR